MSNPEAAVVEIIERRHGKPNGTVGDEIVIPFEVRLNGTTLLIPEGHSVRVHEMDVSPSGKDMVLVTLTLVAKRVTIGQEWTAEANIAVTRLQDLGLLPTAGDGDMPKSGVPA